MLWQACNVATLIASGGGQFKKKAGQFDVSQQKLYLLRLQDLKGVWLVFGAGSLVPSSCALLASRASLVPRDRAVPHACV